MRRGGPLRGSASSAVHAFIAVMLAACAPSDGRTVLTVYSPHGKELLTYYEQGFEQANPGIDVQWVDMGSQEVFDRVRAEKANPQADLWFGAPADMFERSAKQGLLDPYRPTWAAQVPDETHDAQDRWYGTYMTPEVIAYNSEAVPAAEAPKDWDDLLDPKWKDRIVIRDPVASGSMRAIFGALIQREMTRTGSSRAGMAWLRRLDGQTREYTPNATIMYQKLGRREEVVTVYNMPDIATLEQRTKYPVKYVIPASGTPILVDAIAVLKGAKQPAAARKFYEWVSTKEALLHAAEHFARIPARTDIPTDSLPAWVRQARTAITPMPFDRKLMADSLDAWMQEWDATVRNTGHER